MALSEQKLTIQTCVNEVKTRLGNAWLLDVYKNKVRSLRTRSFQLGFPNKENDVEIMHTLLGVEIKAGRKRISCPDLATARYLAVFTRLGCSEIAVPYEINRISLIADELESSWQRMLLLIAGVAAKATPTFQRRVRKTLVDELRYEISALGSGPVIPKFNQNTKQRKNQN